MRPLPDDINAVVGGLLRDLAVAQTSPQKGFGYKRAAAAILALDKPLTSMFLDDGTLPRIRGIGPASTRVILEVLHTGESPTVDSAVASSPRAAEVERRRSLRVHFLSRAEVLQILADRPSEAPSVASYRGDLQMHSEWSDGVPTLAEIVDACIARGYEYAAVTDHSHGLKIAGGLTMEEAVLQREAIERLNAVQAGRFRLIHGIEANIGVDGQLDLTDDETKTFELVLAAPHSQLRTTNDQTERLITTVHNPSVPILAHPRGRMGGSRAGIVADWAVVFAAAAREGVAVEIDGDPARQDLDYTLATRAGNADCLFALDSDAHTVDQLSYVETAIAHARLAGIPPDRIVNGWPVKRLCAWLTDRRVEALRR